MGGRADGRHVADVAGCLNERLIARQTSRMYTKVLGSSARIPRRSDAATAGARPARCRAPT